MAKLIGRDAKIKTDSAAVRETDVNSDGVTVAYIDPVKEKQMMRKFDVRAAQKP